MSAESEARAAIAELDGYSLRGSHIHVEVCVSIQHFKNIFSVQKWMLYH